MRAGLPTLTIPNHSLYTLHGPSSSPTNADVPRTCFSQQGFSSRSGHSSHPSITLTPDDNDDESRGDYKRPRVEGAAANEGATAIGLSMGMGGIGPTDREMDIVAGTEEDSKLSAPMSLTGAPQSDPTSVWVANGDATVGVSKVTGTTAAGGMVGWRRGRSGSGYGR